jgi:hypothetical protein
MIKVHKKFGDEIGEARCETKALENGRIISVEIDISITEWNPVEVVRREHRCQ